MTDEPARKRAAIEIGDAPAPLRPAPETRGAVLDCFNDRAAEDLFWAKVERGGPDECWPWRKRLNGAGYGHFCYDRKMTGAHRAAWQFANGQVAPGLFVCHRCDNRACCNPAHLFLGTAKDNTRDMMAKGRGRQFRVLSEPQVRQIKTLLRCHSQAEVARRLGIARTTVQHIAVGDTWAHVEAA